MVSATRSREEAGFHAFQFLISFILTLPLAAHWVAMWMGWRIFFLADPHIQLVWATLLLLLGGWPFFWGALRSPGAPRLTDAAVSVAVAGLYGYGFYLTLWRPAVPTHPYFQWQAVVTTLITTDRLVVAALTRRRTGKH